MITFTYNTETLEPEVRPVEPQPEIGLRSVYEELKRQAPHPEVVRLAYQQQFGGE